MLRTHQRGQYNGLEDEMSVLQDREKYVQQMMNRWLKVLEECMKSVREVGISSNQTEFVEICSQR